MRIITGEYKGRRIEMPRDNNIRPTTEKVKEAIFSMLMQDIPDAVCVDLFAGTGNLGLEALSRGAEKCYFGDKSRESIALVKRNIAHCGANERAVVIPGEYQKVLGMIPEKADVFFLDPPYKEGLMIDCISLISELELLSDNGLVVAEHGREEELPDEVAGLEKIKEKKYGTIVITIYG